MWDPFHWAAASNDRAIANARAGATECSRRRVERAEVEEVLAALARRRAGAPAASMAEHLA